MIIAVYALGGNPFQDYAINLLLIVTSIYHQKKNDMIVYPPMSITGEYFVKLFMCVLCSLPVAFSVKV